MKRVFLLSLVAFFFVFTSCDETIKDFENVIEITPNDCKKWDLADVHFMISYPTDDNISITKAVEGDNNMSYVIIDYLNDKDLCNEEISIGYCNSCAESNQEDLSDLLSQLTTQFESQLPNFELVAIEMGNFDGKKREIAKFKFGSDEIMFNYFEPGEYLGIITLLHENSSTSNGVTIIMLGNENSGIKDFTDFGEKGKLGDVWKTFRFVK